MSSHIRHGDVHKVGLVDGCPRCAEHAEDPLRALDPQMVAQLRARVAAELPARSDLEAIAMRRLRLVCPQCAGSGAYHGLNGQVWRCWRCGGTGVVDPPPKKGAA